MKKLLKIAVAAILCVTVAFPAAGCGKKYKSTLTVYNWGDYIDKTVLEDFQKEYNIKVVYEEFATNEDMYAKMKAGGTNYDVAIPSDYMIKRMIDEKMVEKIDYNNVPNAKYIEDRFKKLGFDPKDEYSIPYMWGTVGILYNKKMVKEPITSWKALWDEKYSKQIFMLDSPRDSIAVALKYLGYSLNTKNPKELEEAKNLLIKQKPLVLAYVGDEVKDKMINNEATMSVVWSGDAVFMMRENPDLDYVVPKEGSNYWFDSLVIPASSKNKANAELFINYMCSTEVALKNAEYIGYATPHGEAKGKLPSDLTSDKRFYPTQSDLKGSEVFEDLADSLAEYDRVWTEVKSK